MNGVDKAVAYYTFVQGGLTSFGCAIINPNIFQVDKRQSRPEYGDESNLIIRSTVIFMSDGSPVLC